MPTRNRLRPIQDHWAFRGRVQQMQITLGLWLDGEQRIGPLGLLNNSLPVPAKFLAGVLRDTVMHRPAR